MEFLLDIALQIRYISHMLGITLSREYTTIAKGLAILCVILSHLGKPLGIPFVFQFGGIGVAVFLFLSGYGINESVVRNGIKRYWLKRITSVFLVYFIFEVCRLSMNGWPLSFAEFAYDVSLVSPVAPMTWYLRYLLIWYVAYYGAWWLAKIKIPLSITLGCVATALFLYFPHRLESEQSLSFYLGVLYSMLNQRGKSIPARLTGVLPQICTVVSCVVIVFLILIFKKMYFADEECTLMYNMVSLAAKIASIPAILLLANWIKCSHALSILVSAAGVYSYELYLVHASTIADLQATLPAISTFVVLTCALSYLLHRLSAQCRKRLMQLLTKEGGRTDSRTPTSAGNY